MAYIWEALGWPKFKWDEARLQPMLKDIRFRQGRLLGRVEALGIRVRQDTLLNTMVEDVVRSSEIEGDFLDPSQVRSSLANRLGIDIGAQTPAPRRIDGIVSNALDAAFNASDPLTAERLYQWHGALFPTGRDEDGRPLTVGEWRDDSKGRMEVVSGPIGRRKIHFVAPPAAAVEREMEQFLKWFDQPSELDPTVKAAVAHLWFVTIHPFEDGNGRITRNLSDMTLARSDQGSLRLYSVSAQIARDRNHYYDALQDAQRAKGSADSSIEIDSWVGWFSSAVLRSVEHAEKTLDAVLDKAHFWQAHRTTAMNDRQAKMVNHLLDHGWEGNLTSSKWAAKTKTSQATAIRDIEDLIEKGVLRKTDAGGRSTGYELITKSARAGTGHVIDDYRASPPSAVAQLPFAMARAKASGAMDDAKAWLDGEHARIGSQAGAVRALLDRAADRSLPRQERHMALAAAETGARNVELAWAALIDRDGPEQARALDAKTAGCGDFAAERRAEFADMLRHVPEPILTLPYDFKRRHEALAPEVYGIGRRDQDDEQDSGPKSGPAPGG